MQVVGYVSNKDLLLQDGDDVAIIGDTHYVLRLGDRVDLKQCVDAYQNRYEICIAFASNQFLSNHEDKVLVKFKGSSEQLKDFLQQHTVH